MRGFVANEIVVVGGGGLVGLGEMEERRSIRVLNNYEDKGPFIVYNN